MSSLRGRLMSAASATAATASATATATVTQRVVLITGASRGIGLGLTGVFVAAGGWKVIATARDPAKATELQAIAKANVRRHVTSHHSHRTASRSVVLTLTLIPVVLCCVVVC